MFGLTKKSKARSRIRLFRFSRYSNSLPYELNEHLARDIGLIDGRPSPGNHG